LKEHQMTLGPNPIGAEAARKALGGGQVADANANDKRDETAALDEADLQELERAEYYPDDAGQSSSASATKPSLLDRLLRRPPR
jgi:hypothetical protein